MDAPGSAIALWGFNGTMPQSGLELSKEFNPENPPLGSTVVATFVWTGSTNVITSVTDELWSGQQVGNTYNLVEYVTAGGISMATYVASNVQNYPYPKDVLGHELLIRAHLSTAVAGGGTLVSAFTGVNPVFAQALGAHRSGTGSGSTTPTLAHPGAIAVGAGALAYAVSMTSEGVAGRTAPAGFTYLTNISMDSPPLQFDVEYTVPASATSLDPTWGWSFNATHTWLATAIALNPAGSSNQPPVAAFTSSCSALSCGFTSTSSDPDGTISTYSWDFGDGQTSAQQNPSHTYAAAGTYTVALTVTDNQSATNTTSQPVTVSAANQPPAAAFTSSCSALSCSFTNGSSDPDGSIASQAWTFGDGATSQAVSPSHSYAAAGTYSATLQVTDNQGATNSISHSVTVSQPPGATRLTFTVQPGTVTAGSAISPAVRVAAQDASGNTDATYSGAITIALGTNPGGGTLSGTLTATAASGVATFANLSIDRAASGYTLQATAAGLTGATSTPFAVNAPAATRIALDQFNGTLNERDTAIFAKGFNPTNPRLGDVVVATIFWVGPATLVSVSDFMTNTQRTPVGNTFHLVESVTRGGVSMATYVATNIQGFPEPNPDPSIVYAIQAHFSQTVPDGGLLISAYSGVDPNYATAFAGSQSTSGIGTGITPADPGPLTVGAGTLVYSVTMSNGLFGSDKPAAPFADLGGGMSDAAMVADGVYAVPTVAGPSHPRWTYYYDAGQYAWLTSVLALNPAP
ncbi:MAG TPA: PKD domain-containing protein [Gemmatimonadales bacterium]|nr:PKD domain-containing protein [Gemmatimonadales bacterium]